MTAETDANTNPPSGEKPAPDAVKIAAERINTLEKDNADLKDRLLRALAEMENLRRRSEREMQDARAYGITNFARDMLNTADNLRRALEAVPKGEDDTASIDGAGMQALIEGVELTERELLKTLDRHGVKVRHPIGERFDPHRDQAMFEIPDETQISGTVVQVVQTGYMIGERVLRPAMVGVARGGPARASAETEAARPLPDDPLAPERHGEKTAPERAGGEPGGKPRFDKRA